MSTHRNWLMRLERFVGSSLLSWLCIAVLAVRADLSIIDFMLLLIPLANYTVKLDLIAQAIEAGTGETEGLDPKDESAVRQDAPNAP